MATLFGTLSTVNPVTTRDSPTQPPTKRRNFRLLGCTAAEGERLPTGVLEDSLEKDEGTEFLGVRRYCAVGLDED